MDAIRVDICCAACARRRPAKPADGGGWIPPAAPAMAYAERAVDPPGRWWILELRRRGRSSAVAGDALPMPGEIDRRGDESRAYERIPQGKAVELRCRACSHRPRVSMKKLVSEAEATFADGRRYVYV